MIFGGDLVWQAVAKYMPEKVTAGKQIFFKNLIF